MRLRSGVFSGVDSRPVAVDSLDSRAAFRSGPRSNSSAFAGSGAAATNAAMRSPVAASSRAFKASVTAYFAPAVRRQLRRLAADCDTTLQALLGEAVNDFFAKHGLPELVERD